VFNLEKDEEYQDLLKEDLPLFYRDLEEYQEKIANQS
jgi:hypothetical protein